MRFGDTLPDLDGHSPRGRERRPGESEAGRRCLRGLRPPALPEHRHRPLLGGNPLPAANFVPIDDNHVRVVVPGGQKTGLTPVQVNTLFNGKTLPSNNDVKVDVRR